MQSVEKNLYSLHLDLDFSNMFLFISAVRTGQVFFKPFNDAILMVTMIAT